MRTVEALRDGASLLNRAGGILVGACDGWVDELGHGKEAGIEIGSACIYMVKQLCSPIILGRCA